jgi:lipopolysaccharide biosynthesis glycosyltransferase
MHPSCAAEIELGFQPMARIVFTLDKHYFPYFFCVLEQISRFGRRSEGVTVVLPYETPAYLLSRLEGAAIRYDISIRTVVLQKHDDELLLEFKPLSFGGPSSFATYIRLMLPELLLDLDDILYLDVDILVRAPLDELLQYKLNNPLAAVYELVGTGEHLFGSSQIPYFNAGVMRMSLDLMRKFGSLRRSLDVLRTVDKIRWYDQDVLNIVYRDRIDSLPLSYNVSDMLIRGEHKLPLFQDPAIVHFNGPMKPWQPKLTSRFARDWRKINKRALSVDPILDSIDISEVSSRNHGVDNHSLVSCIKRIKHSSVLGLARSLLPQKVKRVARRGLLAVSEEAISKIECLQKHTRSSSCFNSSAAIQISSSRSENLLPVSQRSISSQVPSFEVDLMISVARSGTNALGAAIQQVVPDLNWLNEFFLGLGWAGVSNEEIEERFPWFAKNSPELIAELEPRLRGEAFTAFSVAASKHVVELTDIALKRMKGRTLIKVFPDQLSLSAMQDLLRLFRPRILFVRREMIYSYVSRLRAISRDTREGKFATSWVNADLTNEEFNINERDAACYVARCDQWFDEMASMTSEFGLQSTWVTYDGLFDTGKDVSTLQAFYPRGVFRKVSGSDCLTSRLNVQDRRSDASVTALLKAVNGLSASTQAHLLRLPGKLAISAMDGNSKK